LKLQTLNYFKCTANLLDGIYSDVGERMIGDIDFLVKEEDYFRTAAILYGKGYQHNNKTTFIDYRTRKEIGISFIILYL